MKKILDNKCIRIIYSIIKYVFIILLSLYLLFTIYQRYIKTDIAGYRVYTVLTGSMNPTYKIHDVILIKEEKEYKVGDVITYSSVVNGNNDATITHRIKEIDEDKVVTRGDANDIDDAPINSNQILGRVIYKFKLFSLITRIINNKILFYFIFFVPLVLIIFFEIADAILSRMKDDTNEESKE